MISIAYISVITCDETISVADIISAKMTNTIGKYVSINYDEEKSKI